MKTCTVEGCNRTHLARGLCRLHYDRIRQNGGFTARHVLVAALERIASMASDAAPNPTTLHNIATIARSAVERVAISETQEGK